MLGDASGLTAPPQRRPGAAKLTRHLSRNFINMPGSRPQILLNRADEAKVYVSRKPLISICNSDF
jgi:hypothetical protein